MSVCFSPDGRRLATTSTDGTARVWDARTGRQTLRLDVYHSQANAVCFSPDGRWLATASNDKTAKVWDARTPRELLSLKGHQDAVVSVCFSSDGRRLATASLDGTAKVWDARTGRELLTLTGHQAGVVGVCFSPDGRRLATASRDKTAKVWDTEPLTPAEQAEAEAVALVNSLFSVPLLRAEALDRLRTDKTISDSLRQQAIALAQRHQDDPQALNDGGWQVARRSDASPEEYRRALRLAETASRLAPEDRNILSTLGVAQYRVGLYAEALKTLTRSEALNRASPGGEQPRDLAFLAMVHYRLGHKEQAQAYLARLRKMSHQPRWYYNEKVQGFLHEAEALLAVPAKASTSPANGRPARPVVPMNR